MPIRRMIQQTTDWLARVVTEPRSELTRWQSTVRFLYDLGRTGGQQLRRDRAPQMAAALAYRSLFSLLPLLVVGTALIRAFRGREQFLELLDRGMRAAGLDGVVMQATSSGEVMTLVDWLLPLADEASSRNLTALGWGGLAVLIYAALGFMVTVENSFNTISRASEGRSWIRRIPSYWFVLTVGPLVIAATVYFGTAFDLWIETLGAWTWVIGLFGEISRFGVIWLFLLAMYSFVPNAEVHLRPAMGGAFIAALLVMAVTSFIGVYVSNAVSLTQISGSLGFIPIFMFSVYIFWIVTLFGFEMTMTIQRLPIETLEEARQRRATHGIVEPAIIIAIIDVLGDRFRNGKPATAYEIAEQVGMPEDPARLMLDEAVAAGFVHRLGDGDRGYVLARPIDQIEPAELLDLGFSLADVGSRNAGAGLLGRLREAQRQTASSARLEPS